MPVIVHTYTTGSFATETVPANGPYSCLVEGWGGGGAGAAEPSGNGGGGGGGGYTAISIAVASGDTFTYTVGLAQAGPASPANGADGNPSTITGSVSGGSINVSGIGGGGGTSVAAGAGGTGFNGQVNITGGAGTFASPGNGGAGANGGGAGGATNGAAGTAQGGGGAANVTAGTGGTGARGLVQFTYTPMVSAVASTSQIVLVEGWPDTKWPNHSASFQLFGKSQQASAKYQRFTLLGSRPPPWMLEDPFVSVYSVTEAYQQTSVPAGEGVQPYILFYKQPTRAIEDEWQYSKTDHSQLHQFRWIRLGVIRGYTFEVPDLNDEPWLEWQPNRTDKGAALYPFRQIQVLSAKYQPGLLNWHSKNWDIEAEKDIDRPSDHARLLLLFGHLTPFTPIPQGAYGPFVMDSCWRADQMMTADTYNYWADGVDIHNGGAITGDSGLKGDVTKNPTSTISRILPL